MQLYLRALEPKRPRPLKDLRGIERIHLAPGEERQVSFTFVPAKDLTHYDVDRKTYAVDSGPYEAQIGASSADIRLTASFVVTGDS